MQIGNVKNIPIRVHFTLVITFFIFAWTISVHFMPQYVEGLTDIEYWILGSISTIFLFVSITVHELAHSLVSIRFGIPVRSITLFIFGGVSDISKEPEDFSQEFKIAFAGPLVSFIIAAIFGLFVFLISQSNVVSNVPVFAMIEPVFFYTALINLLLGIFNLVPAFPLDGGRILRASLVKWRGSYYNATRTASSVGIGISYLFIGVGLISLFTGNFLGGIWIMLIGWFLNSGAQSYLYQFELKHILKNIRVTKIMKKDVVSIKNNTTVEEAVESYFKRHMKSEFPIVKDSDSIIGSLSIKSTMEVPKDERKTRIVEDIMTPKNRLIQTSPSTTADKVLMKMIEKKQGKAFVCDKDRLIGVVSKTDILNAASELQEYLKNLKEPTSMRGRNSNNSTASKLSS